MCVGRNKAKLVTTLRYFGTVLRLRPDLCTSSAAQHQRSPRSDARLLSHLYLGGVSEKEKAAAAG